MSGGYAGRVSGFRVVPVEVNGELRRAVGAEVAFVRRTGSSRLALANAA